MKEETKKQLQQRLDKESYEVIVNKGTEPPHSGEYNVHFEDGTYHCKSCDAALFTADAKFDAHCGWPSFDKALSNDTVKEVFDDSLGMRRTEVVCAQCGGHLGHVFNDGPSDTGLRYCVNSASLKFEDS